MQSICMIPPTHTHTPHVLFNDSKQKISFHIVVIKLNDKRYFQVKQIQIENEADTMVPYMYENKTKKHNINKSMHHTANLLIFRKCIWIKIY